jgi:CBS domain-containing protein
MHDRIHHVLARKGHDVETVSPQTTVFVAVERMNERKIGALLVADRYRPDEPYPPIGIFTERDVLVRVVARGLDPKTTKVVDVMTRDLVTVRSDMTVNDAMRLVTEHRCRHLPVVDDAGLCGLISIGDLTSWMVRDHEQTIADLHDYIHRT